MSEGELGEEERERLGERVRESWEDEARTQQLLARHLRNVNQLCVRRS